MVSLPLLLMRNEFASIAWEFISAFLRARCFVLFLTFIPAASPCFFIQEYSFHLFMVGSMSPQFVGAVLCILDLFVFSDFRVFSSFPSSQGIRNNPFF